MKKRPIILCEACGRKSIGHSKVLCRACYEAKFFNRLSNPQKLASRNFIEGDHGIIIDSRKKKHVLTLEEFEKAKPYFWDGNPNGCATNQWVGSLLTFIGRITRKKDIKVLVADRPDREWSYEYKIIDQKKKYTMVIYKAISPSGKVYIGKTIESLSKRISAHKKAAQRFSKGGKFMTAIRKYGVDNFKWEVLETTEDYDVLNALECWYIQYYDSISKGYNTHVGGDIGTFGSHLSEETKEKLRQANLGKKRSYTWTKEMYNNTHDRLNKPWTVVFSDNGEILGYGRNDKDASIRSGISKGSIFNLKTNKYPSRMGITVRTMKKYELQQLNIAI